MEVTRWMQWFEISFLFRSSEFVILNYLMNLCCRELLLTLRRKWLGSSRSGLRPSTLPNLTRVTKECWCMPCANILVYLLKVWQLFHASNRVPKPYEALMFVFKKMSNDDLALQTELYPLFWPQPVLRIHVRVVTSQCCLTSFWRQPCLKFSLDLGSLHLLILSVDETFLDCKRHLIDNTRWQV